ncbi:peptidase [Sphingobium sp. LB126]|uniref:PepSY-associated TM helix domain-containing protein n=1 Tax=Sphingobium sp. LB126 TaxID=1983755 RepID=UPI000C20B8D7|nr:PepSY domain-containing protein [Sphingobium sp. LB126]PJG48829.1 peptidase [Sphingobium sp. LB126]
MESGTFYRAMWRWHFYAGLIVLPMLALMAVTGALYLYKPEIERIVYRDRIVVQPGGALVAPSRLVAAVERASGGVVSQIQRPAGDGESWRLMVGRTVWFTDPHDGRILGSMAGGGVMKTIKDLHSLAITGPIGNRLVEVVAGWAILLCVTGLYLRWPRAGNRALALRGRPGGRLFWRDLHGTVGFLAAGVILFLAVTGMPWTEVWGGGLRGAIAAQGLGRPSAAIVPWSAPVKEALPWALREGGAVPGGAGGGIGVDEVVRIADQRGLGGGITISFPASAGMPWLVSAQAVKAEDARVLTIDAGSGAVAQDVDWRMFGGGAKAVEWGVATHQGLEYGEPNRLLMLAGCLCLLLLCVTAPVLWWKRRWGEPPAATPAARRMVAGLMLLLGVLFPLTGLSMIAALLGEWGVVRLRRA